MIDWLETWSMFAGIGACAAAIATGFYAWLVWRTLAEMHQQREVMKSQLTLMQEQRETLKGQLGELKKQREEMERQRKSTFQPYIRVTGARILRGTDDQIFPLSPVLSVANIGPGSALSVRAYVTQGDIADRFLNSAATNDAVDLADHSSGEMPLPGIYTYAPLVAAGGRPWPDTIDLRIEYCDVFGEWWATTTTLDLDGLEPRDDGQLRCSRILVRDVSARVFPISEPFIVQSDPDKLEEIDQDRRVGLDGRR